MGDFHICRDVEDHSFGNTTSVVIKLIDRFGNQHLARATHPRTNYPRTEHVTSNAKTYVLIARPHGGRKHLKILNIMNWLKLPWISKLLCWFLDVSVFLVLLSRCFDTIACIISVYSWEFVAIFINILIYIIYVRIFMNPESWTLPLKMILVMVSKRWNNENKTTNNEII